MTAAPALLAFVHHLAAFLIFAVVTVELSATKSELTLTSARTILRMDAVYGVAALVVLVVGFARVFHTEKGAAYYFHDAYFIAKIVSFVLVGLLSIYPTMKFLGWRKAVRQQQVPAFDPDTRRTVRLILHVELTLLVVMMFCAALMARGFGFFG
jgi:putative membrane protein